MPFGITHLQYGINSVKNYFTNDSFKKDAQQQLIQALEISELNPSEFEHLKEDDKKLAPTSKTVWLNASRNSVSFSDQVESIVLAGNKNRCKIPPSASTKVLMMGFWNSVLAKGSVDDLCISGSHNTVVTGADTGDVSIVLDKNTVKIHGNAGHINVFGKFNAISVSGNVKSITVSGFSNLVKIGGSCFGKIQMGEEEPENENMITDEGGEGEAMVWVSGESTQNVVRNGDKLIATTAALKGGKINVSWSSSIPRSVGNIVMIGWRIGSVKIPEKHYFNQIDCTGPIGTIDLDGHGNCVKCMEYSSVAKTGFTNFLTVNSDSSDASKISRGTPQPLTILEILLMTILLPLLLVCIFIVETMVKN